MHSLIVLLIVTSASFTRPEYCRDESQSKVDWWIAYKFPASMHKNMTGREYMYLTSDKSSTTWTKSKYLFGQNNSLQYIFMSDLFNIKNDVYIYNDQFDDVASSSRFAHSKGIIKTRPGGASSWLIHSIPDFPDFNSSIFLDTPQYRYGQLMLCISIDDTDDNTGRSAINKIIQKLASLNVHFLVTNVTYLNLEFEDYDNNNNNNTSSCGDYAETYEVDVDETNYIVNKPTSSNQFKHFIKHSSVEIDIYSALVNAYFDKNTTNKLFVQTWPNGAGSRLRSTCNNNNHVYNVNRFFNISSRSDHSKWCVDPVTNLFCIGDLNRESSQIKRGGGLVCIHNEKLATNFFKHINDYENCIL